MKTVAGLWIDHRKAIIATISDNGEKITEIQSNVERQLGRIEGKRSTASFESQLVQEDDRQQRGFTKNLNGFYEKVISHIRDAEAVLIFGPGEAKGELKKIMEKDILHARVAVVESADKMTDRQIAAKTHAFVASRKPT